MFLNVLWFNVERQEIKDIEERTSYSKTNNLDLYWWSAKHVLWIMRLLLYLSFVNLVNKYYTKDSFNWLWVLIWLLSFFPHYFRFLRSILKHLKEYSIHSFQNVMEPSRVLLTPHSENFISMLMSKTAFIRFACTLYRFFHQSPSILLSLTIGKKTFGGIPE